MIVEIDKTFPPSPNRPTTYLQAWSIRDQHYARFGYTETFVTYRYDHSRERFVEHAKHGLNRRQAAELSLFGEQTVNTLVEAHYGV